MYILYIYVLLLEFYSLYFSSHIKKVFTSSLSPLNSTLSQLIIERINSFIIYSYTALLVRHRKGRTLFMYAT